MSLKTELSDLGCADGVVSLSLSLGTPQVFVDHLSNILVMFEVRFIPQ